MYKKKTFRKTHIKKNLGLEGEPIEIKMRRIIENNERIEGEAPLIYTERSEGVLPSYNIKTDRFDAALDATDKIAKSIAAKREERYKSKLDIVRENDGETESTAGTN